MIDASLLVPDALGYGFFRRALAASLLLSPVLSLLGCQVVELRMAYFSDAIGHAGLAGIALGAILGARDPFASLVTFSVLLALSIAWSRRNGRVASDTAIGIFQSAAMALGIVLLSRGGGFARYSRFLVGDILAIAPEELLRLAVVSGAILLAWTASFNRVQVAAMGAAFARGRGASPWKVQAGFSVLVAVAVASAIQWLGILVIQALLILPAASARNLARSTASQHGIALASGTAGSLAGLFLSWQLSTATGSTIVLVHFLVFLATLGRRT